MAMLRVGLVPSSSGYLVRPSQSVCPANPFWFIPSVLVATSTCLPFLITGQLTGTTRLPYLIGHRMGLSLVLPSRLPPGGRIHRSALYSSKAQSMTRPTTARGTFLPPTRAVATFSLSFQRTRLHMGYEPRWQSGGSRGPGINSARSIVASPLLDRG